MGPGSRRRSIIPATYRPPAGCLPPGWLAFAAAAVARSGVARAGPNSAPRGGPPEPRLGRVLRGAFAIGGGSELKIPATALSRSISFRWSRSLTMCSAPRVGYVTTTQAGLAASTGTAYEWLRAA